MISVVLFDLDDTLFAHRQAVANGVLAHLDAVGISGMDAAAARWRDLEELHYARYLSGELDYLGQRRARARDFAADFGVTFADDSAAEEWFDGYARSYRAAWMLHDDALPMLETLRTHRSTPYRVGVITNGTAESQQTKIERLGLAPYVEHVVTSAEFGAVKPHPSIFLHACALFGVAPDSAVYVGDRLKTDALGARGAGLAGVWLDRAGVATTAELAEADSAGVRVIRSLAELAPLLPAL